MTNLKSDKNRIPHQSTVIIIIWLLLVQLIYYYFNHDEIVWEWGYILVYLIKGWWLYPIVGGVIIFSDAIWSYVGSKIMPGEYDWGKGILSDTRKWSVKEMLLHFGIGLPIGAFIFFLIIKLLEFIGVL